MDNPRAGESDLAILQLAAGGSDAKLEGGGKNNASVVIRVIPEDFYATGCERFDLVHTSPHSTPDRRLPRCKSVASCDPHTFSTMSETLDNTTVSKKLESSTEHAKKAIDAAAQAGRSVGDSAKKEAKAAYETSREHLGAAAKDLGEAATATYGHVRHRANSIYSGASDRAHDYQHGAESFIRENPLQSVAVAVGVGFILGILLRR